MYVTDKKKLLNFKKKIERGYRMEKSAILSECPVQIGIVVPSLEKAMERAKELLGIEGFDIKSFPPEGCDDPKGKYHGEDEDFAFRQCTFDWGNIQLEFLEPIRGRNAYVDYLKEHPNGGIHHLQFLTEDHEKTAQFFQSKGIKEMLSGTGMVPGSGKCWKYYNTAPLIGFDLEIVNKVIK